MIRVRITGVDAVVRSYDRTKDGIEDALTTGTEEAADYLIDCIQDKFGKYQPGWEQLKYETIHRKKMNKTKPLVEYADMMFSFNKMTSARTRKHIIHVTSNDPKLIHHMYGAPVVNLPKRDPVRPTVKEENEKCLEILRKAVEGAIK
jgi:hypothetical protein